MEMEITDPFDILSDDVLVCIITNFLDMQTASITIHISKRWERVWAEMTSLKFEDGFMWEEEFVSWINRAIAIRKGDYLEKLEIEFWYSNNFDSDFDAWVEFCVKNKVKQLTLKLHPWGGFGCYSLPEVVYSYPSLTTLSLLYCMILYEGKVKWDSLTDLTLHHVKLNQHLLDEILSTCSVLKKLELMSCPGFKRLTVNTPCLQRLAVDTLIYLNILSAHRDLYITLLLGSDIRKIPDVITVDLFFRKDGYSKSWREVASDFFESFKHVIDLHLQGNCIQVLSTMMENGMQLPQFKLLQHLKMHSISSDVWNISGIILLLKSSPKLQTLSLYGFETKTVDNAGSHPGDLDGDLLHLRKITINNFAQPLLKLASILLRRAPALEEMVIAVDVSEKSEVNNISDTLSTSSSSRAKIRVSLAKVPAL